MVEKFNIYSGILIVSSKPSVKGVGSRIQDLAQDYTSFVFEKYIFVGIIQ